MTLKNYNRSKRFERNFKKLPEEIKDAFYNQFKKLHTSHPVMHPSLRIKGVQGQKRNLRNECYDGYPSYL